MNKDFNYIDKSVVYLDSACQTLRPEVVLQSMENYYREYNSCGGGRTKYSWGKTVDDKVDEARSSVLSLLRLTKKDYFVSFTQSTTYGINLLLSQLKLPIDKVITTEIEHNSVFVPTISFAKKNKIKRVVLKREVDGSLSLENDFKNSLVVINAMSNIDGRLLNNIKELVKTVHRSGGFIIIDAAQAMGSNYELLQKVQADAICTSAHKMYSASLGVMIIRKDLIKYIEPTFLGGGQVADVDLDSYELLEKTEPNTLFEPGLLPWAEIVALTESIPWLMKAKKESQVDMLASDLYAYLKSQKSLTLINNESTSVISFYHENLDSHLIAKALSNEGVMVRSGYFCCHYYLKNILRLPPLVRISIGLHTNKDDISKLKEVLERLLN